MLPGSRRSSADRPGVGAGVRALLLVLALTTLSGCTEKSPAGCPADYDAMVTWSSDSESATELQFYGDGELKQRVEIDVQGVPIKGDLPLMLNGKAYVVTNGDIQYDQTNLVTIDLVSCEVQKVQLGQPAVLDQLVVDDVLLSTNYLDGVGYLKVYELATGRLVSSVETPNRSLGALSADERFVYAFTNGTTDDEKSTAVVIDRSTWSIVREIDHSSQGSSVTDSVVVGRQLYFTLPELGYGDRAAANDRIGILDLDGFTLSSIKLDQSLPYQFVEHDQQLFVAHTFVNGISYQEFSEFQYVSTIDLQTRAVVQSPVGGYLNSVDVDTKAKRLLTLHAYGDEVEPFYTSSPLDDVGNLQKTPIVKPLRDGYSYISGIRASVLT